MKKLYRIFSLLLCIILFTSIITNAQLREQRTNQDQTIQQPLDINSKAQELGISAEQLSSILNSASSGSGESDPLPDAMQERFFTGQAAGDEFGWSVASAGDVNGDGYDDIVVGAPYNDAVATNAGRAYIYFGGNVINSIPDVILIAENVADGNFGWAVASAGDANGDGYDDVIVGAPNTDFGGIDAGTFYVFFGGFPMNGQSDFFRDGYAAGDKMGISVSSAGDVNGDGYADLLAGATYNDAGGSESGSAYIFFGGTFIDIVADVIMLGASAGDYFGAVSAAGDVNGDGFADVIVGSSLNDYGGTDAGSAYIYFGGTNMNNNADVILTGDAAYDRFGNSVSKAGDVNGDGYSDVVVGAVKNDYGGTDAGRAYIYYGGTSMNETADVILTGVAAGDNFGQSVSTAGDVNGDGYSDVIVGAWYNDAGGTDAGRSYIYYGGLPMDNAFDVILSGAAANDNYGFSVSTAGDVNGDGYSDVIIGSPFNDANGTDAGRSFLYTNSMTGIDIPDEIFTGTAAGDSLGHSVSTAGDVNGDGYADLIVGVPSNDGGGSSAGCSYIYFGGPDMDNIADVTLTGAAAGDKFGFSVSTAGDVNGDGYSDVIVGAFKNDAGGSNAGSAYVYFGGNIMNNSADVILTGIGENYSFGKSVSTAGDVNGDGYADVIVGEPNAFFAVGRIHIFFGGITMDNIADVIILGGGGDRYGSSVSSAGDINGDGYDDIIVGVLPQDKAHIYLGGTSMDETIDVTLFGQEVGEGFGFSVSTAGDVNGDGYSDVIVGAPGNSSAGPFAGRAYVYFGSSLMTGIPDATLTGFVEYSELGYSVSTAGDVNNDGYDDVVVGGSDERLSSLTAAYVLIYFGGNSMDNTHDIIFKSDVVEQGFGRAVSTAGDVNADGLSDVIVGWVDNDEGGTNAGRANLYISTAPTIQPRIMSVKDVPADQGGYLFVNFIRSGYELTGRINGYEIEMSEPPSGGDFNWIQIGTVLPLGYTHYTYLAHTLYDSSLSSNGTFYFRVTAVSNQNEQWPSNIISGHSIDNLSPLPPLNFYANLLTNQVKLGWKANTEEDFKNYILYRTDVTNANPDTLDVFATVMDTTFIDSNPLTGNSYYFLRAQDVHNNLSPAVIDSIVEQTTFALTVSVNNGWNMVSIPGLHPTDQNVNTWWQYREPSANVFKYSGGYVIVITATPGTGYWMKHTGARTYNTGEEWPAIQIVSHIPIGATAGWNMFGGYEDIVPASGLTTTPPGLISGPVYGYSGGYYTPANLEPGYGYWVKLSGTGLINIPDALAKENEEVVEWFPGNWGRIILTDATGVNYTLYAVKGEVDLSQYELPPAPMAGMFDIRFSSGRIAEDLNSAIKTIEMSGVTYPLTVRVEGMDIRLMDETGKNVNVNLKSGEDVVISDATIQKLMVSGELIPAEYALEQNYPNPFNPSTVIEFSLPEDVSNVKLSIYNALGEKVAELVNTALTAGKYQYQWNAQNVATGMYIYELRTNKFVSVKKMILIK